MTRQRRPTQTMEALRRAIDRLERHAESMDARLQRHSDSMSEQLQRRSAWLGEHLQRQSDIIGDRLQGQADLIGDALGNALDTIRRRTGEIELAPAQFAKRLIRNRRRRDSVFDSALFADPGWDMLLDLFIAGEEGRHISVSSLCIAAAVPPTTALRWIGLMEDAGHFLRAADPSDQRRIHIELAPATRQTMHVLLADMARTWAIDLTSPADADRDDSEGAEPMSRWHDQDA